MNTSGEAHAAPSSLPSDGPIVHRQGMPRLLVFVHRQCPCSRATLTQLEGFESDEIDRTVVFVGSESVERNARALEERATGFADRVLQDPQGTLATQFGALTSGHVVVYDTNGAFAFGGGVTPGRGMVGPSGGIVAIRAVLQGDLPEYETMPVFGCPLSATPQCEIEPGRSCGCDK